MLLCTNRANRLSGESDNDLESADNDEFFGCLFNQSEPEKDAAAKRIEGFLSVVLAKKIDDNSFANAALKKLFVQYNTFYQRALQLKGFSAQEESRTQGSSPRTQKKSEAKDSPSEDRPSRGQ